jgi:hypothetical protein
VFRLIERLAAKFPREHLQIVGYDGFDFFAGPIIGFAFGHGGDGMSAEVASPVLSLDAKVQTVSQRVGKFLPGKYRCGALSKDDE